MSSSKALVSIIIPCYNQGAFLGEAIESALGQTYPRVEVIVVDDGSTDHTAAVAVRFGERIRYRYQENGGVASARNRGVRESHGEFVLFLDADDFLPADLVECHMAVAAASPTGTVFHGGSREVDTGGRLLHETPVEPLPADAFHALLTHNPFSIHSVMIRRSALVAIGLLDVNLRSCEDWDLWIRLAAAGYEFVPVAAAVAIYRRYAGSKSTRYEWTWRLGMAVLAKNRGIHPDCSRCRRSIARGVRNWGNWCFDIMTEDLAAHRRRGETWAGVVKVVRAANREPQLGRLLARGALDRLPRMALRLPRRVLGKAYRRLERALAPRRAALGR